MSIDHAKFYLCPHDNNLQVISNARSSLAQSVGLSPDQAQVILDNMVINHGLSEENMETIMSGGMDKLLKVGFACLILEINCSHLALPFVASITYIMQQYVC